MNNNYEEIFKLYKTILYLVKRTGEQFGETSTPALHFAKYERMIREEIDGLFDLKYCQEEELKNVNKVLEDGYLDEEQRNYLLTLRNNLQAEVYKKRFPQVNFTANYLNSNKDVFETLDEDGEENDNWWTTKYNYSPTY